MARVDARTAIAEELDAATRALAAAGIDSARTDAEQLAAHVLGVDRGRLLLTDLPADFVDSFRSLIAARSDRIPLQHLVGTAPFGPLTLRVGPGVFIPRPETESMLEWAMGEVGRLASQSNPLIVDLCTGSGALAIALARHRPDATVLAIDDSTDALEYARHNTAGTEVRVIEADVTEPDLLAELDGRVDLVVCNPPYIPVEATLDPEVAEHDPHHALFGGEDGMSIIGPVTALAGRWLKAGGGYAVEHDDTTSVATVELIRRTALFAEIQPRRDLAGRLRFVTAVRGHGPATQRKQQS